MSPTSSNMGSEMKLVLLVTLALGSLSLGGCGTFSDRLCGPRVAPPAVNPVYYRGVRFDILAAKEGGAKRLMLLDIPFSAIWDTFRVPFLAHEEWTRKLELNKSSEGASAGSRSRVGLRE